MTSTASLNRAEIARLDAERKNVLAELHVARNHAPLLERLAEIDRAIAWCNREIDVEEGNAA